MSNDRLPAGRRPIARAVTGDQPGVTARELRHARARER
jgi:hypothetical protein